MREFIETVLVFLNVPPPLAKTISWIIIGIVTVGTVSSINQANRKLKKLQEASEAGYGATVNAVNSIGEHAILYGQDRVGGLIFYRSVTNNNQYLHTLLALTGHECEEIVKVFADDKELTINPSTGMVTAPAQYSGKLRIKKHLGSDTQAADSDLIADDSAWTADHKASGIAYIYIRAEFDQDSFPQGFPVFSALVKGKKLYDPRKDSTSSAYESSLGVSTHRENDPATWQWSDNSALCVRDYVASSYGLASTQSEIDEASFAAAATICDQDITLAAGGTEKRYTTNGPFLTSETPNEIILELVTAMAGTFYYSQGQWGVDAGAYSSPVLTLTEDDLLGAMTVATRNSRRDNFNAVEGTYSGEVTNYMESDYPKITSETFVTEDNGEEVIQTIPFDYTATPSMAQRLAKIALYRSRQQLTMTGTFGSKALQVKVGDNINITNSRLGFSSKPFEVADWSFSLSESKPIEVKLTLREISSDAFDWGVVDEQSFITDNTTLPDPTVVATPSLSISGELREVNQSVAGVLIADCSSNDASVIMFEVEYKASTDTEYVSAGRQKTGRFEIIGLNDGLYDVRVKAINFLGVGSDFATVANFNLQAFATPPDNVTNFAGNVIGSNIHLSWTPVTNLDLSHYKIRYSQLTSGATYSNAVDVVDKIARPANTAVVPAQTGTYFIKAVDKLGGASVTATGFVVVVDPLNVESFNAVQTITENPSFAGTKTNVVATSDDSSDYIALKTTAQFDDQTGDFDDFEGLFDGGGGTVTGEGLYQFANYLDFTQKYTARIYPNFQVDYADYVNDFDAAAGNFDDREGLFDGDADQFDTTSATFQMRHTDGDPSGSPTWTSWQDFIVGDVSARAVQFRAKLTSSNGQASPLVRQLGVQADMPIRVESQDDVTFTGTKSITFPDAFKDAPALGISLANLADGERYAITNKTRSGFTIQILNGGTQSTNSVTMDYVAKGYGKELT